MVDESRVARVLQFKEHWVSQLTTLVLKRELDVPSDAAPICRNANAGRVKLP